MDGAPKHGDLLTESDVLEGQLDLRDQKGTQQDEGHRLLIGRGRGESSNSGGRVQGLEDRRAIEAADVEALEREAAE
jgi:hypothetical protein